MGQIDGLAASSSGFLLEANTREGVLLFASTDGLTWERIGEAPALGYLGATCTGFFIAEISRGFKVAPSTIYISDDGQTWHTSGQLPILTSVATSTCRDGRILAAGLGADVAPRRAALTAEIWASTDAATWQLQSAPIRYTLPGSFPDGISALATGSVGSIALTNPFAAQGEAGPSLLYQFWLETEPGEWTVANTTTDDSVVVNDVAATDGGFFAVGSAIQPEMQAGHSAPMVITSSDGHTWDDASISADRDAVVDRVVAIDGGGLVALGRGSFEMPAGGVLIAWTSNDGREWLRSDQLTGPAVWGILDAVSYQGVIVAAVDKGGDQAQLFVGTPR